MKSAGAVVVISGLAVVTAAFTAAARAGGSLPVPTSPADFFEGGTQPETLVDPVFASGACSFCHSGYDFNVEPGRWAGSMHAHAVRDPIFRAAVEIAEMDAPGSGETCFRCHAPLAFLNGRVSPPNGESDGSMLEFEDLDGIACHICHRMVDPNYVEGVSPAEDEDILAALSHPPTQIGNAQYVIDPLDVRRGPFNDLSQFHPHEWLYSPFHSQATMCGTCHDVSNPMYERDGSTDTYVLAALNAEHPSGDKHDMFPEQRTFSEFNASAFAAGVPVADANDPYNLDERFGGNLTTQINSCQDCHMPDTSGYGCLEFLGAVYRDDVPLHAFAGGNTTALEMILHLYSNEFDTYVIDAINASMLETVSMLERATDLYLTQQGGQLTARLVNQCGHKLGTGYPEGRRTWVNVQYFDGPTLIEERGAYDPMTATLTTNDTKVYEIRQGLDSAASALTGLPTGKSFHLVLNNTTIFDNRIPPRGFTNAGFDAVQAEPVGYAYADGQHWDDSLFAIPDGATSVTVNVYHQTASREYIEFLRDTNTNPVPNAGTVLHDAWVATGKSTPVLMDSVTLPLTPFLAGDIDLSGEVDFADLNIVLSNWGSTTATFTLGDANSDGVVDFADLNIILAQWGQNL